MADEEHEEGRDTGLGFKVEDKRRFDPSGRSREEGPDERESGAASTEPPAGRETPAADPTEAHGDDSVRELGELSFSSFVIGLASQALMFLGLAPDPQSGVLHKDLPQAKALIDIIAMLQDKTRGNLADDEASMMDEMLYELRMQYVRERRSTLDTKGEDR